VPGKASVPIPESGTVSIGRSVCLVWTPGNCLFSE
jgi:hypothetical protein